MHYYNIQTKTQTKKLNQASEFIKYFKFLLDYNNKAFNVL